MTVLKKYITDTRSHHGFAYAKGSANLRHNNFDLLRFIFAFVVLLVHAYALTGESELAILDKSLSSDIAVKGFFIVSGFLIFMSYENSSGLAKYFWKRFKRIYPGYFVVIFFTCLLVAVFVGQSTGSVPLISLAKYFFANLFFLNFLQPDLPGVFEDNSLRAINGALWTLKIEAMFYLSVPIIAAAFSRFGRMKILTSLFVLSAIYSFGMQWMYLKTQVPFWLEFQRQLPGQLMYFLAGAAGYYFLEQLKRYAWRIFFPALCICLIHAEFPAACWLIVQPLALGAVVLIFAVVFPFVGNFSRYGDFSYGIYILHFPIMQLLIAGGFFDDKPWQGLFIAIVLVMSLAFLLWHIVEKRFLVRSHYVSSSPD